MPTKPLFPETSRKGVEVPLSPTTKIGLLAPTIVFEASTDNCPQGVVEPIPMRPDSMMLSCASLNAVSAVKVMGAPVLLVITNSPATDPVHPFPVAPAEISQTDPDGVPRCILDSFAERLVRLIDISPF